jgi:hypothetical protein
MIKLEMDKAFILQICTSLVFIKLYINSEKLPDSFGVFLFRNFSTLEGQIVFDELCDFAISATRLNARIASYKRNQSMEDYKIRFLEYLECTDPEHWIAISAFPLFEYEKKSKMFLCEQPLVLEEEKRKEFRTLFLTYVLGLNKKSLFTPPDQSLYKIGTTKYNDGGTVKVDSIRADRPDSGFLYQKTMTKHLVTREIWLPGKSIKVNNSFWMNIGMQLLREEPAYPSVDPHETFELIKERLNGIFIFDLPGFGFQFPRELLSIAIDVLQATYPSSQMEEHAHIAQEILSNVNVQLENRRIITPIRGIGLGYYESLKTLCILAILKRYNPISIYGDQGLISNKFFSEPIYTLASFGFLVDEEKCDIKQDTVKWSGYRMSRRLDFKKPRLFWSKVFGALTSQTHWERKKGLQSIQAESPKFYSGIDRYISFHYEHIFGFEFFRSDSMLNFYNTGVSKRTPVIEGYKKTTKVEHMLPPSTLVCSDIGLYNLPDSTDFTKSEARDFSKKRKEAFRSTKRPIDDLLSLYIHPRIEQRKKLYSRAPRGALPEWADLRLVATTGATTGRITYGLQDKEIMYAMKFQCFAPNPFMSRAMGGYSLLTKYHRQVIAPEESREIAVFLSSKELYTNFLVKRYDQDLDLYDYDFYRYKDYIPDVAYNSLRPPKRSLTISTSPSLKKVVKRSRLYDFNDKLLSILNPKEEENDNSSVDSLGFTKTKLRKESVVSESLRDESDEISIDFDEADLDYDILDCLSDISE